MERDLVAHLKGVAAELYRQCIIKLDLCQRLMTTDTYQRDTVLSGDEGDRVRTVEYAVTFLTMLREMLKECNDRLLSAERPSRDLLDYVTSRLEGVELELEFNRGILVPMTEGNALLDAVRVFLDVVRDANNPQLARRSVPDPAAFARGVLGGIQPATPSREYTYEPPHPGINQLPFRPGAEHASPGYPAGRALRAALAARFPVGLALRAAIANQDGDTTFRSPPTDRRGRRAVQEAQAFTEQTDDPNDPQFWQDRRNWELRREQPFDFTTPPPYVRRQNEGIINTPVGAPPFVNEYFFIPRLRFVPGPRYYHPVSPSVRGASGSSSQRQAGPVNPLCLSCNLPIANCICPKRDVLRYL